MLKRFSVYVLEDLARTVADQIVLASPRLAELLQPELPSASAIPLAFFELNYELPPQHHPAPPA